MELIPQLHTYIYNNIFIHQRKKDRERVKCRMTPLQQLSSRKTPQRRPTSSSSPQQRGVLAHSRRSSATTTAVAGIGKKKKKKHSASVQKIQTISNDNDHQFHNKKKNNYARSVHNSLTPSNVSRKRLRIHPMATTPATTTTNITTAGRTVPIIRIPNSSSSSNNNNNKNTTLQKMNKVVPKKKKVIPKKMIPTTTTTYMLRKKDRKDSNHQMRNNNNDNHRMNPMDSAVQNHRSHHRQQYLYIEQKLPNLQRLYRQEMRIVQSQPQLALPLLQQHPIILPRGGEDPEEVTRHFPCWRKTSTVDDVAASSSVSVSSSFATTTTYQQELQQLTWYTQLTPDEIQLRCTFVQQLEDLVIQQLSPLSPRSTSSSTNYYRHHHHHPNNPNNSSTTHRHCQIFGSFASIPICTFQSDLDIALWNIGINGPSNNNHNTMTTRMAHGTTPSTIDSNNKKKSNTMEEVPTPSSPSITKEATRMDPRNHRSTSSTSTSSSSSSYQWKKEQLIKKWKIALEAATNCNNDNDDDDDVKIVDHQHSGENDTHYSNHTDSNNKNGQEEEDDDDDSIAADPMLSFVQRQRTPTTAAATTVSAPHMRMSSTTTTTATVVSSTTTSTSTRNDCPDIGSNRKDDSILQVSFCAVPPPFANGGGGIAARSLIGGGPQGYVRTQVVRVLSTLSNTLRKKCHSRHMHLQSVTLIKTAKVPIIKLQTTYGFQVDIAVGGYGTDTSLYAKEQIKLFPYSFTPVVVFLKMLLSQHHLDEPFTGGLGSYKLYILVADHIHRHLQFQQEQRRRRRDDHPDAVEQRGRDGMDSRGDGDQDHHPFEMLYTFLYRYGYGNDDDNCRPRKRTKMNHSNDATTTTTADTPILFECHNYPTTKLHQHIPFMAYDGTTCADLSNVYKLHDCIALFRLCYNRLKNQIQNMAAQIPPTVSSHPHHSSSLFAHVICPFQLQSDRERMLQQTQLSVARMQQEQPILARQQMNATTTTTSTNTAFSSTNAQKQLSISSSPPRVKALLYHSGSINNHTITGTSRTSSNNVTVQCTDRTLEEIVAGYGIHVEDLTSP
jgi:hypothetical protein